MSATADIVVVGAGHNRQETERATRKERAACEAPRGEFVLLEDGNQVCANVPYVARPLFADRPREKLG